MSGDIIILDTKTVMGHYMAIMSTEERLEKRQQQRDSRELDTEVWIVHDKDDGSVVGAASTKTMAIKRAWEYVYRGYPLRSWKRAFLPSDRFAIRKYRIKEEH